MSAPDESAHETMAAVLHGMLRLFAAYIAFSVIDLIELSLRLTVVLITDPGEGGTGPISALLGLFRTDGGGETWAGLFLLITVVVTALKAVLLLWALRPRTRGLSPGAWLGIGLAGLVARLVVFGTSLSLSLLVGKQGVEALAALSIASNLAAATQTGLWWCVTLGVLIMLYVRLSAMVRHAGPAQP